MSKRTCVAPGCDKPANASRGWCWTHYTRWYRTGSLTDPRPTAEQRFLARINKMPDGCWHWDEGLTHGYGKFYAAGQNYLVHRWAYEHFAGPIPDGMTVDHRCHDGNTGCAGGAACLHRRCVNPQHLKLATWPENIRRGVKAWQTHCKHGHEFTDANTYRDPSGRRVCRTCLNARKRAWRKRHPKVEQGGQQ